jgi:hypothetical protein
VAESSRIATEAQFGLAAPEWFAGLADRSYTQPS